MDERIGDLSIRSLLILNKNIFDKWCWRFTIENESVWKQVIIGK